MEAWETKDVILEDGDMQNITYDVLQGNLIAYEQKHIYQYNKYEKKKIVEFTVEKSKIKEENVKIKMKERHSLLME